MTHHIRAEAPLHVVFVISTLGRGGSERQMINLAAELNRRGHRAEIAILREPGPLAEEARSAGIPVLPMSRSQKQFASLLGLVRYVRRLRPQIVHPYLPRENATVTVLKPFLKGTFLIWGIRASNVDYAEYGVASRLLWPAVVKASRWADLLIANSQTGTDHHVHEGFASRRIVVIPNGIDTVRFGPNSISRADFRKSIGASMSTKIIGLLGRFDPMKGHKYAIPLLASVVAKFPDSHLVMAGLHEEKHTNALFAQAKQHGLTNHVTILPPTSEPESFLSGIDVLIVPSVFGEGFPNVVAEALSCGTPVVAFDVGDVKQIISCYGSVVPQGDISALSAAILRSLDTRYDPDEMHSYIARNYSIARLADRSLAAFYYMISKSQGR